MKALADAGFHAVAPDMRGYGQSDAPLDPDAYTQPYYLGDIVGLLGVLLAETGQKKAVMMGHDRGATVCWNLAMIRPDLVRGVVGLSLPTLGRSLNPPTVRMREADKDQFFYQLYFQPPGVIDHELRQDVPKSLRTIFYSASGEGCLLPRGPQKDTDFFLHQMRDPESLPPWLTQEEFDCYVSEYERTGFRGGLNIYRSVDLSWELTAVLAGAKIHLPCLFIAGEREPLLRMTGGDDTVMAVFKKAVPGLTKAIMIPGAGHWIHQERPTETNEAILDFLRSLPDGAA
jgi:pimeloyl-ACP methyl ester carboxylesterase